MNEKSSKKKLEKRREFRVDLIKTISESNFKKWYILCKEKKRITWGRFSMQKRVEAIFQISIENPLFLSKCLRSVNPRDLVATYKKFVEGMARHSDGDSGFNYWNGRINHFKINEIGKGWKKKDIIGILVKEFFYNSKVFRKRRTIERKNLKYLEEEGNNNFQLSRFCGISMPTEIISLIFSFLPQNLSTIDSVGSASKSLYLSLLSNWNSITIKPDNIFSFSLLVFRNVGHITVAPPRKGENPCFQRKDLFYLTKENKNRFNSIHFRTWKLETICSFLSVAKELYTSMLSNPQKENSYPFRNVNEISFCYKKIKSRLGVDPVKILKKFNLFKIFPSLTTIKGLNSEFSKLLVFKECRNRIENLQIQVIHKYSWGFLSRINNMNRRGNRTYRTQDLIFPLSLCFPSVKKLEIRNSTINELYARTLPPGELPGSVVKSDPLNLLEMFPNLEELCLINLIINPISFFQDYIGYPSKHDIFNFGQIFKKHNGNNNQLYDIRKLVINDKGIDVNCICDHQSPRNRYLRVSSLLDLNVNELHISSENLLLDFSTVVSENWFSNDIAIKKLKFEFLYLIPIESRKTLNYFRKTHWGYTYLGEKCPKTLFREDRILLARSINIFVKILIHQMKNFDSFDIILNNQETNIFKKEVLRVKYEKKKKPFFPRLEISYHNQNKEEEIFFKPSLPSKSERLSSDISEEEFLEIWYIEKKKFPLFLLFMKVCYGKDVLRSMLEGVGVFSCSFGNRELKRGSFFRKSMVFLSEVLKDDFVCEFLDHSSSVFTRKELI